MKNKSILFDDRDKILTNDRLKACPFCGGTASVYTTAGRDYVVMCNQCGAMTTSKLSSSLVGIDESLASAVRTWQNRFKAKAVKKC